MTDTAEQTSARPRRTLLGNVIVLLPVAVFGALAVLLLFRLFAGDPSRLPSALIGSAVPEFEAAALEVLVAEGAPVPGFSTADLREGEVRLVNVWGSWCVPCREEHPYLMRLAEDDRIEIYGINYKDQAENARRFLGRYGNPFDAVGIDPRGRIGIDWGVYGVPETFVVGRDGTIVYKHVGPLTADSLAGRLMPEIEAALGASETSAAETGAPE